MAGKNRIVRTVQKGTLFPSAKALVDSTSDWNQGDLLIFDDTTNKIRVAASEGEGSTFLGIAEQTVVDGILNVPYSTDVDASRAVSEIPGPAHGVVAKLVLKTGAALNPGDLVYLNPSAGNYHVQEAGTKAVGVYAGAAISSASAGQEIEVLLGHRHPGDSLKI
jgi:hypothetical protein